MDSPSTSATGSTHRAVSAGVGEDALWAATTLLHDELPVWRDRLADEVLSVYRTTEVGKRDGGLPMQHAVYAYLTAIADSAVGARALSRDRMAILYARAGLDISAHFELSARLLTVMGEPAAPRWRSEPRRLLEALIEVQRLLWEDARCVSEAFVHERERHLGELVKHLSVARTELAKVAHDDPLTGVRNRGYLVETLSLEFERARRYHEPFSILFIDLDHFKSVNDAHGHEAGDEVLQEVAHLLKRAVRPQDVLGRYGGDEFVVGLVRANAFTAGQIAERLRSKVAAKRLPHFDRSQLVTLSIGAVTMDESDDSIVELIRKADAAMYAAKAAGRNQVRSPAIAQSAGLPAV
jgi:diguanylate cyclase (GGDEF)-like protein